MKTKTRAGNKRTKTVTAVSVGSGRFVSLSAEDIRTLKEAGGRRGYALPRFNPRTGTMLTAQWQSWKKLQRNRLAEIEGSGEADDLILTDLGRQVARQANTQVSRTAGK